MISPRSYRSILSAAVSTVVLMAGMVTPHAALADDVWNTPNWCAGTDSWINPSNWRTPKYVYDPALGSVLSYSHAIPTATDAAYIDNGGTAIVDADAGAVGGGLGGGLFIGNTASGTLNVINGGAINVKGITQIGYSGSGMLNISNGGMISGDYYSNIGWNTGSTGGVTVDGAGSTWSIVNSEPTVAWSGGFVAVGGGYGGSSGTLHITHGGAVSSVGGLIGGYGANTGAVTVDGYDPIWRPTGTIYSTWTNTGDLQIGTSGGTTSMVVTRGGVVSNVTSYIGGMDRNTQLPGVATVVIDGVGSRWTNSGDLYIGPSSKFGNWEGNGVVNIINGGAVSSVNGTIGGDDYSTSIVTVNGAGSSWTNTGTLAVVNGGVLNITTGGVVSSAGGTIYPTGVITITGDGSTWINNGSLTTWGGTVRVANGGRFNNADAYIGYYSSTGAAAVTVAGVGSTWANSGSINIGGYGRGTLNITNSGAVSSSWGTIGGWKTASTGAVTVDGAGSTWANSGGLSVGSGVASGTLNITHGGVVTASSVSINTTSLLAMDIGCGSRLVADGGNGTINNNGMIRLCAGVYSDVGNYQPISAGLWSGSGTVEAIGGSWNPVTHQFVILPHLPGIPALPLVFNRRVVQRVSYDDPKTGWAVSASFGATTDDTNMTFMATPIEGTILTDLQGIVSTNGGGSVLNGWVFAPTSGYVEGEPAYLSLNIGSGLSPDDLKIWHFDGSTWTPYTATDLTYDGTYANFTVTGFSGYAVSAVPEPTSVGFITIAGFALMARRHRKGQA